MHEEIFLDGYKELSSQPKLIYIFFIFLFVGAVWEDVHSEGTAEGAPQVRDRDHHAPVSGTPSKLSYFRPVMFNINNECKNHFGNYIFIKIDFFDLNIPLVFIFKWNFDKFQNQPTREPFISQKSFYSPKSILIE